MKIAVATDEQVGIARSLVFSLEKRGLEPVLHGALVDKEHDNWAWTSEEAARDVAEGRADQAIICCWTGTGAAIAANKIAGVRAALCLDAETSKGARLWNDANALVLSLRNTSEGEMEEILDAWFNTKASSEEGHRANIEHIEELDANKSATS